MEEEIAKALLRIKAVFLSPHKPFTWASGIKSPIYCDNRLTLTAPEERDMIENALVDAIRENYPGCEAVMGTSTAGIAHAAIIGHIMGIPMGYVRSFVKDHGRANQIEGKLVPGQKVVVVEDLISTAGSAVKTAEVLRSAGANVLGIVSIFTYGMKKGLDKLAEHELKNVSLCCLDGLLDVAVSTGHITESDRDKIIRFRDDPFDEEWMKEEKQINE